MKLAIGQIRSALQSRMPMSNPFFLSSIFSSSPEGLRVAKGIISSWDLLEEITVVEMSAQ